MNIDSLSTTQNPQQERTFSVGILIALASWSLMFITIFWGYLVYRWRTNIWLESFISTDLLVLALINTAALIVSGFCLREVFKHERATIKAKAWTFGFWALSVWFLIGQVWLWRGFVHNGLTFRESVAANFFFLLTGFHAVHIIGALIAVAVISLVRVRPSVIKGVRYFWDFLTVVWSVMFVVIFVLR